ncbi:hypothetical protein MJH12_11065, partial [bacterium]|nr:hypothetical protein [bacterium]
MKLIRLIIGLTILSYFSKLHAMTCSNGGNPTAHFIYSAILKNNTGETLSGFQSVDIRFDLHASIDSLAADYSQAFSAVEVQDGVFKLELGPCLPNLNTVHFVQLAVNNKNLSSRTRLLTLPLSIHSYDSQKLSGLTTQEIFQKVDQAIVLKLTNFVDVDFTPSMDGLNQNLNSHLADNQNPHLVNKTQIGLAQVDDVKQLPMSALELSLNPVSDVNVPSSKAVADHVSSQIAMIQVTGFEIENPNLVSHLSRVDNPHSITRSQLNLDFVSNVLQLPMSYFQTVLSTTSDVNVPSSSAVATFVNMAIADQTPTPASALTSSEVSNLKANTLANGASPWTSNVLPTGTSSDYLRGDRTFVAIPADQLTSLEVTNIQSNTLADGSTPWTGKDFSFPAGISSIYLRGDRTFVTIPADQFNATEVSNVKANTLANGSTPWTSKEDTLPAGSSSNYLRGDRTFVVIPADQFNATEVSNVKANTLADGSTPWTGSEGALGVATSGQVLAGDRTWKQLNPSLVGLALVKDLDVLNSFTQNLNQFISTSKIKANTSSGLLLENKSGQGMYISSNGFVGINNMSPLAALDVNGLVRFSDLDTDTITALSTSLMYTAVAP